MVDYDPWNGNYTNTVVRDNVIMGGFSTDTPQPGESKGANSEDVIIKYVSAGNDPVNSQPNLPYSVFRRIGVAIGPRTWFGDRYGQNVSANGTVMNNRLSGAFGYGFAMSSASNFTVENNTLFGNTSFIGARGPNCSSTDTTPSPAPFIIELTSVQQSTIQTDFQSITDGDGLTCISPPDGGDYWPFGGNPENPNGSGGQSLSSGSSGLSGGAKAGIAIAAIAGFILIAVAAWFIRRIAPQRAIAKEMPWDPARYVQDKTNVTPPMTQAP